VPPEREMRVDLLKLLQGGYEAEILDGDPELEGKVPDFAYNILYRNGLLYEPLVDQERIDRGGKRAKWPLAKRFAVCLTHDVDTVVHSSLRQESRRRSHLLSVTASLAKKTRYVAGWGLDVVRSIRNLARPDALSVMANWLREEAAIGVHSTFFFWPGWKAVRRHHRSDCLYDLDDRLVFDGVRCSVAEMIREIDRRGWEIGLHPSWSSFSDLDELKHQKEALERALGKEVHSVRQHLLHYDIRTTPGLQAEAGFKYDSSLGFNDNIGFRFGTCYPWRLHDLRSGRELPTYEIPLLIQDGALLSDAKGLRVDGQRAFEYVRMLLEKVESVGGIATLLWHPHMIIDPVWWDCYRGVLGFVKEEEAYVGSVKEVMEAFLEQGGVEAS